MKVVIEDVKEYESVHIWVKENGDVRICCNTDKWCINLKDAETGGIHIHAVTQ